MRCGVCGRWRGCSPGWAVRRGRTGGGLEFARGAGDRRAVEVDAQAVIVGGGCAGLSLAVHVVEAARRAGVGCPRVVVLEPRTAYVRDRTWCGWGFEAHPFAASVTHRWDRWAVQDGARRVVRGSARHPYEHIPADRFYAQAQALLAAAPTVRVQLGAQVTGIAERGGQVVVESSAGSLRAGLVLDSRPEKAVEASGVDEVELVQHFAGWEVETGAPCFDPGVVEMMDFAAAQARGMHFMYVLPFSPTRALVEATYISPRALPAEQYEADIRGYLERRGAREFQVGFREAGQIAMSTRPMRSRVSPRVLQIGLRGGLAKPSTGYAFAAIQRFSATLAERMVARPGQPVEPPAPRPAAAVAMDRVFLSFLARHPERGPGLFVDLFERLPPDLLCRFLTDHGSPLDGLRVMASTPLAQMTAEVVRSRARWLRRPAA